MRLSTPTLLGLLAAAVLVPAAPAQATTQQVSLDGLTATYTYAGPVSDVTAAHLTIAKDGHAVYSRDVTAATCGHFCGPALFGAHSRTVGIAGLQPGPTPQVILELYTGGASCCFVDQVFSYVASSNTFTESQLGLGAAGAKIEPIGSRGRLEFVSADSAFKYEFSDGADSGLPLEIWQFSGGRFSDVTPHYPRQLRADATRWLRLFSRHLSDGVGLIAPWAADEELLGHNAEVQAKLAALAAHGQLRDGGNGLPTGRRFVAALNRFLRKHRYEG